MPTKPRQSVDRECRIYSWHIEKWKAQAVIIVLFLIAILRSVSKMKNFTFSLITYDINLLSHNRDNTHNAYVFINLIIASIQTSPTCIRYMEGDVLSMEVIVTITSRWYLKLNRRFLTVTAIRQRASGRCRMRHDTCHGSVTITGIFLQDRRLSISWELTVRKNRSFPIAIVSRINASYDIAHNYLVVSNKKNKRQLYLY